MNRLFALFGKLILGTILLAVVLAIGYFVGTHKNLNQLTSSDISKTEIQQVKADPSMIPAQSPQPSAAATQKIVTGGLSESTAFSNYTISLPLGWKDTREAIPNVSDKLMLSKDKYMLTIYQAALGGGGCIYKGDPASDMAQAFTDFAQITGKGGDFRRSWNEDIARPTIPYTICQKASDNSYGSITKFGRIDAISPNPVDAAILSEMDSIIVSLKTE